jgi:hypothetical protein
VAVRQIFLEDIFVEIKKKLLSWKEFLLISYITEYEDEQFRSTKVLTVVLYRCKALNVIQGRRVCTEGTKMKMAMRKENKVEICLLEVRCKIAGWFEISQNGI